MNLLNYIVLSLFVGIQSLVAMRNSAEANPVPLTRGVLISLILCAVASLAMVLGASVGSLLRFDLAAPDKAIFLGVLILVVVKTLFSIRRTTATAYDISRLSSAIAVSIALGINVLLLGLAIGFVDSLPEALWKMILPTALLVFLMAMWGIMLGRKAVDIRPRRWQYIGLLCLLVVAIVVYIK